MLIVFGMLTWTFLMVGMGYAFGKLHERIEWNKLIEAGILPKPFERR